MLVYTTELGESRANDLGAMQKNMQPLNKDLGARIYARFDTSHES